MIRFFESLGNIFYPTTCQVCDNWLVSGEEGLCLHCDEELPRTGFSLQKGNPTERIFYGRIPIEFGGSFLFFHDQGIAQKLLHKIKYKGQKELAEILGKLYGIEIQKGFPNFKPDFILPVPLHPRKERQRGYNQSLYFGKGLADQLGVKTKTDALKRVRYTQSQTNKGRFNRWMNVGEVFAIKNAEGLENKTVILVDDVITTGSTLEACLKCLVGIKGIRLGVLTLGLARG